MFLVLITLITISIGCGSDYCIEPDRVYYQTKEIEELVYEFQDDYQKYKNTKLRINRLIIKIKKIEQDDNKDNVTIGLCFTKPGKIPIIELDKKYWSSSDYYNKKRLLYHELGHCVLKYGHPHEDIEGIMAAKTMPYKEYINNEQYYIEQFFMEGK